MRVLKGLLVFSAMTYGMLAAGTALANDALTEVLREKGVITKEDWIKIKAEQEKTEAKAAAEKAKEKTVNAFPVKVGWGKKGFTLETLDGKWKTALQWRFQGRFSYPERSDPRDAKAFSDNEESTFELRRVRMKVGGHGYQPWIKYYFEVDWQPTRSAGSSPSGSSTRLIDWRIMLEKYKWLQLRIGQWKINYNRERVDSSGKQQFVERSIVNRVFTIDRQVGAMLYGHLAPGTLFDSRYYVGVWTGSGRGEANDDDNMMYMGRLQWNFLGRDLKWTQSDIKRHQKPTGSVAFAAYTTKGKCTRWSSSGCGTLGSLNSAGSAFTGDGAAFDGQFRVEGMMEETAFKWKGFSLQHEYHWKQVTDISFAKGASGRKTNLMGSYAQVGYFFHELIPAVPEELEVAFRYAFVDPNVSMRDDKRQEFTGAVNWFFAGHRNKLTLDTSHLTLAQPVGSDLTEQRVRLQWDVSF